MSKTKLKKTLSQNPNQFHLTTNSQSIEQTCIKAGLKKELWEFFKSHSFDSLEELYAHRNDFIVMYTSFFGDSSKDYENLPGQDINNKELWSEANHALSHIFASKPSVLLEDPLNKHIGVKGCYKIKIRIIDLHKHFDGSMKPYENSCCSKFAIKPKYVESIITLKGAEYKNPFYSLDKKGKILNTQLKKIQVNNNKPSKSCLMV